MRVRIFAAFVLVATAALVSNILFGRLVGLDFEDLVRGGLEDDAFAVTAAVEGSYGEGEWNRPALQSAVLWALMRGYEIIVRDVSDNEVISSAAWAEEVDVWLERRLIGMGALPVSGRGAFTTMPLFLRGDRIGTLSIRPNGDPFGRRSREARFRSRNITFLWISLGIAGAGTVLFGFVLFFALQRPLHRFVKAAERVRTGDLSVIIPSGGGGDLEKLRLAFNEMIETLGRQEERRKCLVTEVAHELRTPLTILRGTLEGMEDGVLEPDPAGLRGLLGEVRRLEGLVAGIEEMARAEAGRFFLEKKLERLDTLAEESVRGFQKAFQDKGLDLRLEGDPVEVDMDGRRIRQVLDNLLQNALRHTEQGGVTVRVRTETDHAIVEVADTGSGISEKERPYVFDRFYRGAASRAADGGEGHGLGLGLGLAIVKEVVEAHSGTVETLPNPEGGSTFRIRLPLRKKTG